MLQISVFLFPLIAIVCGIVSLVSVIKFIATIYAEIRKH